MEIKQTIKLHNKFEITVCDAASGNVKQEAVAYNVILDNYFKVKLQLDGRFNNYASFDRICFGKGDGTPTITDTALFSQLGSKNVEIVERHYDYPTSYGVFQIKINADEYNGQTITEVGMQCYSSNYPATDRLLTHAMLQDAEGNRIAIAKTDVDVVFIRATFYCTFTQTGWGDNGVYPLSNKNTLVQWLIFGTDDLKVKTHRFPISHSSDYENDYIYEKTYHIYNGVGHLNTLTFDLPELTILDTEFNNHTVKNIGISGFGAFQFPDPSVFPDYAVTRLMLGEGDGETTDFNIKCPLIKSGSVHIFVGDLEKTAGTDYTVDLESNCNDVRENYYTANMHLGMSNVKFGDIEEKAASSGIIYDPFYFGRVHRGENLYATYASITQAKPIWFDFGEAKECNRFRLDGRTTVSNANNDALVIEYSNDNINWTAVNASWSNVLSGTNIYGYKWSWNAVSARYWRIYRQGLTWTQYINNQIGDNNGVSGIYSIVYLGKSVPGLHFNTPPEAGQTIEASYLLNVPYKTANNLMKITCSVQLQRGL